MCMRDIAITTARLIWQFDAASVVIGTTHRVRLVEVTSFQPTSAALGVAPGPGTRKQSTWA